MPRSDVLVSGALQEEELPYSTPWISTLGLSEIVLSWNGIEDGLTAESPTGGNLILTEALTDSGDPNDITFQGGVFGSWFEVLSEGVYLQRWRTKWSPGAPFVQLQFQDGSPISLPVVYALRGITY